MSNFGSFSRTFHTIPRENAAEFTDVLAQYFDADTYKRFEMIKLAGGGISGIAWKLKYDRSNLPSYMHEIVPIPRRTDGRIQYIALKTPRDRMIDEDDMGIMSDDDFGVISLDGGSGPGTSLSNGPLRAEMEILNVLKWGKHIVRLLLPIQDSLSAPQPDLEPHRLKPDEWIYMEWLENGTVGQFIRRAMDKNIQAPLPNRLLWRMFLCLIRIYIALGWPPRQSSPSGPQVTEQVDGAAWGRYLHTDIHYNNMMFGDMVSPNNATDTNAIEDPQDGQEHDFAPIIKLIDFYNTKGRDPTREKDTHTTNLWFLAGVMQNLITLSNTQVAQTASKIFRVGKNPANFAHETNAIMIVPASSGAEPYPGLDPELRDLVCLSLAVDSTVRLELGTLVKVIEIAIAERDEAYYKALNIDSMGA
ncbi:hypothetical protein F5Y16DRAFT_421755 [Xylariaceae sp. FL0255]|nr:hypothetical protein F5Y16DRAFT_421755 [Xylariaceae sp. FL0255]